MKTMISIQTLILIFGLLFFSCSKDDNANLDNHQEDTTESYVDTLDGLWFWYATYHPKKGIIKNEHNASIKIAYSSNDSLIKFETYSSDTLLKRGNFKLYQTDFGLKIQPSIIPFSTTNEENYVRFLSKDSIEFYEDCNDCPIYYFTSNNADTLVSTIQLPVFDTLQGSWSWYATYDSKKGLIENGFDAEINFISVNQDTSINFQTIKEGTDYKLGKINISQSKIGYKVSQNIIPNYTALNEIYFNFSAIDSLSFFEDCNDCPIYYYKKLNQ